MYLIIFLMILSCVVQETSFAKAAEKEDVSVEENSEAKDDELSQSITFEDLADGEYFCYRKIKWGTSKEEVEKELNISLEYLDESIQTHYTDKDTVKLEEMDAEVTYEFRPDLETISFCVDIQDEEQLDQVLKDLEEIYGTSESGGSKENGWVGYRWFKENDASEKTSLQIIADYEENILSEVNIYIGIIPQQSPEEGTEPEETKK